MTPAAEALREHIRSIYAPIDRRFSHILNDAHALQRNSFPFPDIFTPHFLHVFLFSNLFLKSRLWILPWQSIQRV
jgi:hypothetical protein